MKKIYGKLKGKGLSRFFPTNFFAKLAIRNMKGDHTVNVQDFKMTVPIKEPHGMVLYLKGVYEPAMTNFINLYLREGQNFVDVGACLGYYSLLASHIVKDTGKVLAFEPEWTNLTYLEENVGYSKYKNIEVIQKAASDRVGEWPLNISDHIGCHSLLHFDLTHSKNPLTQITTTIPVDQCIDRIDMIKIDVEGWEYYVLKGIESFLALNENKITVLMEYCPSLLNENELMKGSLLELLKLYAVSIFILDDITCELKKITVDELLHLKERVNLVWWTK